MASALALSDPTRKMLEVIGAFVALYAQLFLTARVLDGQGAMPAGYERHQATEGRLLAALVAAVIYIGAVLLGLVLLVLPGVLIYLLWGVWMPATLAERRRPISALRRSWQLVRPRLGWTARFTLATLAVYAISMLPVLPVGLVVTDPRVVDVTVEAVMTAASLVVSAAYAYAFAALRDAAGVGAMPSIDDAAGS